MLYNVVIDKQVASNRDKLVESLYLFLNRYIPTRLIYENEADREDATQDTIIFILQRYDKLRAEIEATDESWSDKFNYEKYFFNRARSYLSYWIRKKKRDRDNLREYIENAIYFQQTYHEDNNRPIDYTILKNIAKEYNFDDGDTEVLVTLSALFLEDMGYAIDEDEPKLPEHYQATIFSVLHTLAYSVVDEYLINVVGE